MAKSMRSKWRRKMRAIKREKMEVKVLARLENMLATAEVEKKLDNEEKHYIEKKKLKTPEVAEMTEVPESNSAPLPTDEVASMEVEGEIPETGKFKKVNVKTLRLGNNQFPSWMSTKKIRYQARIQKKAMKKRTKENKKSRCWKSACST